LCTWFLTDPKEDELSLGTCLPKGKTGHSAMT
jgi:hypothetical protein